MIASFIVWWHGKVLHHDQDWRRVSVPSFDMSARGYMVYCECGRSAAL